MRSLRARIRRLERPGGKARSFIGLGDRLNAVVEQRAKDPEGWDRDHARRSREFVERVEAAQREGRYVSEFDLRLAAAIRRGEELKGRRNSAV
jgi:hypothetical protein